MFSHQTAFSLLPFGNAVPAHSYSSSEGSENFPFGASASGDAFVRAGSTDSAIGSLAASDEPYLPARQQPPPAGNPSPLSYSVAPEFISGHPGHPSSPGHVRTDPTYDMYDSQYRQQSSYLDDYTRDGPYIPPNFYHPPPLAIQSLRHFGHQQQHVQQPSIPPSHSVPHPLIAPQVQRDLPDSPLSSSSDGSIIQDFGHQVIPSMPPSPPRAHSMSDIASPHISDPTQVPLPGDDQQGEGTRPELHADDGNDSEGSTHSQHWIETDRYLRNQIGIPEGTRVSLWALPDPPPGQKPQQPLPILVKLAIHGCARGMLTLQEIYQTLEDRFDYFARLKSSAWKNSIRHNLSLNQVFRSCDRPITEPGKGRYWSLDISKGEGYKRERRRKRRNAAPYNGTRDLPGGIGNRLNPGDSSDPDQEVVNDTPSAGRAATVKTSKRGRKRGPYTRITIGQPSIPGSTGITAGGAAAAALVSAQISGSNSPVSGAPSPPPHTGASAAPSPTGAAGAGSMTYAATATATTSTGTPHAAGASSTTSLAPPTSQQENQQMRGVQSTASVTLPHPFPSSYHGMYFNRAPEPTFGQTSLGAASTFVPQTRVGFLNPVGSTSGHGRSGSAISISSDEMSSPEMGERRLEDVAGGRMIG